MHLVAGPQGKPGAGLSLGRQLLMRIVVLAARHALALGSHLTTASSEAAGEQPTRQSFLKKNIAERRDVPREASLEKDLSLCP